MAETETQLLSVLIKFCNYSRDNSLKVECQNAHEKILNLTP